VITALFALFVEASLLGLQAVADARAAKAGVAGHPTFLGIPILGWGADPVTVAWLSGTPPQGLPSTFGNCLMYLGRADGIAVIYDVGARETIRVPSSAVMVTTASTRSSCRHAGQ